MLRKNKIHVQSPRRVKPEQERILRRKVLEKLRRQRAEEKEASYADSHDSRESQETPA